MSAKNFLTSAPLEPLTKVKERLEKKTNDLNGCSKSAIIIKEMITHFREEITESNFKNEKSKRLSKNLEGFDMYDNFATTATSVILSVTGIVLTKKYKINWSCMWNDSY